MKNDIRAVLEGLGYTIPSQDTYTHIALWRAWYKGYSPKFHDYKQYNGKRQVKRRRKGLRMGKKVCEDHANLLLNEKVQIVIDNKAAQEKIDATLAKNKFRVKGNRLVELAYALGTGAFVEHDMGDGTVAIDYIPADMIFPLAWDDDTITACAFASVKTMNKAKYLYLNIHEPEGTEYVIRNKLVPIDKDAGATLAAPPAGAPAGTKGKPVELQPDDDGLLPGDLAAEVHTGSLTPRFQFIGPNQVNNVDRDSPLGASVFANSLDLLEGIDLVFDSYCGEFRLGKKRIIVPLSMLEIVTPDGEAAFMTFDDADTEFYGMKNDDMKEIKEIDMELRVEQHDQALQRFLNILSTKCGLGNDRYKFETAGVKTATEVISEKSELYQNLKKNELVLEDAIKDMCRAIAEITGVTEAFDVKVNFDDSIIEDSDAKRTRIQLMATQGKFPLWLYYHEYEGYSEEDAKKIVAEAKAEATAGGELDFPDEPQRNKEPGAKGGAAGGGAGGGKEAPAGGDDGGGGGE